MATSIWFGRLARLFTSLRCIFARNCGLQRSRKRVLKHYVRADRFLALQAAENSFTPSIHRTILWDDCEPLSLMPMVCSVRKHTQSFSTVLWNAAHLDMLIRANPQYAFYDRYPRRIMRADLARYLIMLTCGGVYFDLDIRMHRPIEAIYAYLQHHSQAHAPMKEYCILFEEHRWSSASEAVNETSEPIRNCLPPEYRTEALTRVANYAFLCTPGHPFIAKVLELCKARAGMEAKNDYDVLFITGPDVVSHVFHTAPASFLEAHNVILIPREKHDEFITHHHVGNWRNP